MNTSSSCNKMGDENTNQKISNKFDRYLESIKKQDLCTPKNVFDMKSLLGVKTYDGRQNRLGPQTKKYQLVCLTSISF